METMKSIFRFAVAIGLAVIAVPILIWIGLAAIGAAVLAALVGSFAGAWAINKAQKERGSTIIEHE
ncbi:MAG: hypothetical protein U5K75_06075 [Ahrensia sp.]|nr:hypothetical protein [Ahrensia sp.]